MLFLLMLDSPAEESLFESIYNTYNKRIFAICFHYVGDFHDAEEITQSVFFKAAENIKRLKSYDERHMKAFLYTVAKHLSLNLLEKKSARPIIYSVRESDSWEASEAETALETEEALTRVKKIVKKLPEIYQEIMILSVVNSLKVKEIAELLNLGETTVKNRISRAKKILQKKIQEEGFYEKE